MGDDRAGLGRLDLAGLLAALCAVVPDRRPGSPGNAAAVDLVAATWRELGWQVECPEFPVVDWEGSPGTLALGGRAWAVHPSPYATGWSGAAPVRPIADEEDLAADLSGCLVLIHGGLASAPLTPKGYPFYGSDRDARIIERLESSGAVAVVAVTGRYPELAGALDPFPLIEDGAFEVPAAAMTVADGDELREALAAHPDALVELDLPARRWPATARNILARRGDQARRVTVVAHLDTKPGTPGALDNGSGVVVLCRVAELLAASPAGVELLAVNGEDYYAASGELAHLASADLSGVLLAVNIDGAGLRGGATAWSGYGVPAELDLTPLTTAPGIVPGPSWPQSDHMVFAAAGCPAVALTSEDLTTVMEQIAHTPGDTPDLVDPDVLERTALAIARLVESVSAPR